MQQYFSVNLRPKEHQHAGHVRHDPKIDLQRVNGLNDAQYPMRACATEKRAMHFLDVGCRQFAKD